MLELTKEQIDELTNEEVMMVYQMKQQQHQVNEMRRRLKDDIEVSEAKTIKIGD